MSITVFCSGKGAPGVTTLVSATGAVWSSPRPVLVAECDPSGNDLAVRFGLNPGLGMTSLVLDSRSERNDTPLDNHIQVLPGGLAALVGPVSAAAARRLDTELAQVGVGVLPSGHDVLVDCGRIVDGCRGQEELLTVAGHVVLVIRPDPAGIAHARAALGAVRSVAPRRPCSVITVGTSSYPVGEIEDALEVTVAAAVPHDHTAAAIIGGAPGRATRLTRSRLVATARNVAIRLAAHRDSMSSPPSKVARPEAAAPVPGAALTTDGAGRASTNGHKRWM